MTKEIKDLDDSDIKMAYKGINGCLCGCGGKFYSATPLKRMHNKTIVDDVIVKKFMVERILNKIKNLNNLDSKDITIFDNIIQAMDGKIRYILYLN